jgi:hypothetical protein
MQPENPHTNCVSTIYILNITSTDGPSHLILNRIPDKKKTERKRSIAMTRKYKNAPKRFNAPKRLPGNSGAPPKLLK